ncbi:hypothetical protein D3C79_742150 [compost metagenome]
MLHCLRISPSMPSSPNSLTITAIRRPWALSSICRSNVVLPEPRKPVTMVTGSLASVFMSMPLAGMAGMRDENRRRHCLGAFATGSPRPVYVGNCSRQVSWLALLRPKAAGTTPSRRTQWLCRTVQCLQLRGQPRLEPRSRLSFGQRRRTSKRLGYAVPGKRSTAVTIDARPYP